MLHRIDHYGDVWLVKAALGYTSSSTFKYKKYKLFINYNKSYKQVARARVLGGVPYYWVCHSSTELYNIHRYTSRLKIFEFEVCMGE